MVTIGTLGKVGQNSKHHHYYAINVHGTLQRRRRRRSNNSSSNQTLYAEKLAIYVSTDCNKGCNDGGEVEWERTT